MNSRISAALRNRSQLLRWRHDHRAHDPVSDAVRAGDAVMRLHSQDLYRHREQRLEDILADSIVRAVMEADGVNPRELETELRRIAALLRWRHGAH